MEPAEVWAEVVAVAECLPAQQAGVVIVLAPAQAETVFVRTAVKECRISREYPVIH